MRTYWAGLTGVALAGALAIPSGLVEAQAGQAGAPAVPPAPPSQAQPTVPAPTQPTIPAPAAAPAPQPATPPAVPPPAAPPVAPATPTVPSSAPAAAPAAVPAAVPAPDPAAAPAAAPAPSTEPPVAPVITTEPPARTSPRATTRTAAEPEHARELEPVENRAPALYLRLGFGVGLSFGSDVSDDYVTDDEAMSFSGFGTAIDWMGGAAVLPQLIVGLGATTDTVSSGTIEAKADNGGDRKLTNSLTFAVLGAFADYYVFPPAGFHLQLLLGLSHLSRTDDLSKNTGNGFGTVLGAGYDFAVGRRFNMGVLARVAVSSFGMDEVAGRTPEPMLYEPTLLWTITFRPAG